jgi:hypothetical protein
MGDWIFILRLFYDSFMSSVGKELVDLKMEQNALLILRIAPNYPSQLMLIK